MPKGKITDAWANGTIIKITFLPEEGNIKGKVNIPCPKGIIDTITQGRPVKSGLQADMVAKKLIGTKWDIGIFGQTSKDERKKDLKRRGLWEKKNRKYKVDFYRKENTIMSMNMAEIEGLVDSLEEMEEGSFTIFTKEPMNVEIIKKMEGLFFIDGIKHIQRIEVR